MNCREARELISPWIDGMLTETEEKAFSAHMERCGLCQAEAEELRRVLAVLKESAAKPIIPPPGFADSVMKRLREEEKVVPYPRRVLGVPLKTAAMAASLFFLLGMNGLLVRNYLAGKYSHLVPGQVSDQNGTGELEAPVTLVEPEVTDAEDPGPAETMTELPEVAGPQDSPAPESTVPEPVEIVQVVAEPEPGPPAPVEELEPVPGPEPVLPEGSIDYPVIVASSSEYRTQDPYLALSQLSIPEKEVFSPEPRTLHNIKLRLKVQRVGHASNLLADAAGRLGAVKIMEDVLFRDDARLVKVFRYDVPRENVNAFLNEVYTTGKLLSEVKSRGDVTEEYNKKLEFYNELLAVSQTASGTEAEMINQAITNVLKELEQLNRAAREMQTITIMME